MRTRKADVEAFARWESGVAFRVFGDSADPTLSVPEQIAAHVGDRIVDGRLPPGTRIGEQELADEFKVSRGPVREAIQRLEREGLVMVLPNRGATVARLSREDLDEVHSLRSVLERLAVCESIKHADAEHLDRLAGIVEQMVASDNETLTGPMAAELDTRFHQTMVEASGHKRLIRAWLDLRPQIHIFLLSRNVANPDFREHLVRGHSAILNVVRDRDEARAIEIIDDHMKGAYVRVMNSYPPEP